MSRCANFLSCKYSRAKHSCTNQSITCVSWNCRFFFAAWHGMQEGGREGGRQHVCGGLRWHKCAFYCESKVLSATFWTRILRSPESQYSRINSRYFLHKLHQCVWCRVVRCLSSDIVWIDTGNITRTLTQP